MIDDEMDWRFYESFSDEDSLQREEYKLNKKGFETSYEFLDGRYNLYILHELKHKKILNTVKTGKF